MQDVGIPYGCDDGTLTPTSPLQRYCELDLEACEKMGRRGNVAKMCKQLMEEAGFVDVVEVVLKWPTNTWPKDPVYKEIEA